MLKTLILDGQSVSSDPVACVFLIICPIICQQRIKFQIKKNITLKVHQAQTR